ncbi:MAG: DNA/RNA non-specific endonuclease [Lachnospiraceae bacterium]|nr:DNA/RNA non-specific endonuclease [Lachnospiraceae bacterium]
MKKIKTGLIAVAALLLCSCANTHLPESNPADTASVSQTFAPPAETARGPEASEEAVQGSEASEEAVRNPEPSEETAHPSQPEIEPYSGQPYAVVNDNVPYFSEEDLTTQSFESYSELDELGRCGAAYACVGLDLMPTKERGQIGNVRPTGWHTIKYNEIIDGNYLYNRCHLIGYLLSGENANEKNLITGTRYLNVQGMLPFENTVADYVTQTGNHVLYRVTPIFLGDNLLASGVLMEAKSVEDRGEAVSFCVYVYNVQPGIAIDYATGESALDPNTQTPTSGTAAMPDVPSSDSAEDPGAGQTVDFDDSAVSSPESSQPPAPQDPPADVPQGTSYILNTNTHKFHYPACGSVKQMKDKNKQEYTGSREDVISMGYDPCKNCNP